MLPKRQIAILKELSKELSDTSFSDPLDTKSNLADLTDLVRYGYLEFIRTPDKPRLAITDKGRLILSFPSF